MDWTGILANELAEEEEMSMFATQMRKRVANLEDKSTLISDGKRPKQSSTYEDG